MIPATLTIIGGAGFLGRCLIARLATTPAWESTEVRCLDRVPLPDDSLRPQRFRQIVGDAQDPEDLAKALDGADAVWLRAAMLGGGASRLVENLESFLDVNVGLVNSVVEAAETAECRRIFFDSSEQIFGDPADQQEQTPWAEPVAGNYYGATKAIAEKLLRRWSSIGGERSAQILRYSRVRSASTRDVVRVMLTKAMEGEPLRIFGDSTRRLAFVHVDDVIGANMAVLARAPAFAVYHVGADRPISLLELAVRIREVAHATTGRFSAIEVGTPAVAFEPHVVGMRWEPSIRELGLPSPRGLDEMLLETVRDLTNTSVAPAPRAPSTVS